MRSKIVFFLIFIVSWSLAVTNSTENVVQDSLVSSDYGVMLVSTLDGYLTAIDAHTGLVKWRSKENPVLESPINIQYDFTFIPNPRDGQLYLLGDGKINKLPFTIPELVRVSPCRSADGILYAGSKKDVWIAINPDTGERIETLTAPTTENSCPVSHPKTVFIGRTEYHISMMDAKKRERRWNATFSDYSSHLLPVDHDYPFQHFTCSSDGRIVTVDALTGQTLWKREFTSIIVNLYLLKPDGMHKLPSTTVGKETLEALLEEPNPLTELHWADELLQTDEEDDMAPQAKQFFPTLYVGETPLGLYAVPAMVNEKTITIAPKYLGPPLLEGPMPIVVDIMDAPRNMPTKRPILPANTELYGTTFKTVDGEFLLLGYHQVPAPITKQLIIHHGPDLFKQPPVKSIGYDPDRKNKKDLKGHCVAGRCYPQRPQISEDEEDWTFEKILSIVWHKYPGYLMGTLATVFLLLITTVWMCGRQSAVHSLSLAGISPENSRVSRSSVKRSWSLFGVGSDHSSNGTIPNGWLEIGKVQFNPKEVLGRGCEGTVVYRGKFDGRSAAVKRVMSDLIKLVDREVDLLRESDFHPNIIRYFCSETDETFRYIALELCECSLQDYVEKVDIRYGYPELDPVHALKQATDGVAHLHSINIVHRDLKPQNILITNVDGRGRARVLISDFGLCKKIKYGHHSISRMSGHVGTEGWMAPELILSEVSVTCAVDVFSLGCIFYYVLVNGQHPFGNNKITRQDKIIHGEYDLKELLQAENHVALNLIESMLQHDAKYRPTSHAVATHPFFWNEERQLQFFMDVSDRVEKEDEMSPVVQLLEKEAWMVVRRNWHEHISRPLAEDLRRFRSYRGSSVRDLLRALRNKKHHYRELPDEVRESLGDIPYQFVRYFTLRFPKLLMHVYKAMIICATESVFTGYYPKEARCFCYNLLSDEFDRDFQTIPIHSKSVPMMRQHVQNSPLNATSNQDDWVRSNNKKSKGKKKKKAPFAALQQVMDEKPEFALPENDDENSE